MLGVVAESVVCLHEPPNGLFEVAVGFACGAGELAERFGLAVGDGVEVVVELGEVGEHGVALCAPWVDEARPVVVRVSDVGEEFVSVDAEVVPHLVACRVVHEFGDGLAEVDASGVGDRVAGGIAVGTYDTAAGYRWGFGVGALPLGFLAGVEEVCGVAEEVEEFEGFGAPVTRGGLFGCGDEPVGLVCE